MTASRNLARRARARRAEAAELTSRAQAARDWRAADVLHVQAASARALANALEVLAEIDGD